MKKETFTGPISVSSRGVGYFQIEGRDEDIEIAPPLVNTALHNDEVEVELLPPQEGIRAQGKVIKIIRRAKTQFVGTLEQVKGKDDVQVRLNVGS
jgi:ribonuclease R/exosome complex exonuclease DIS3/RRP44